MYTNGPIFLLPVADGWIGVTVSPSSKHTRDSQIDIFLWKKRMFASNVDSSTKQVRRLHHSWYINIAVSNQSYFWNHFPLFWHERHETLYILLGYNSIRLCLLWMLKVHYALRTQENTRCEFHWECTWKTGRKLFVIWIQLTSIHGAFWKLGRNVTSLIYTMMCVIQVNNDETSQMYFPSDTICSAEQERTIFQVTYSVLMRKGSQLFCIHQLIC